MNTYTITLHDYFPEGGGSPHVQETVDADSYQFTSPSDTISFVVFEDETGSMVAMYEASSIRSIERE